jgi:protein lifeguard
MERINFLIQVYCLLVLQILCTMAIIYTLRDRQILPKTTLAYFIISLIVLLIMIMVSVPFWFKVILFILFTFLISAMLYSITFYFTFEMIRNALIGAITVFIVMTVIALVITKLGYDLSWMGVYLLIALIMLIIGYFLAALTPGSSSFQKIFVIVGLVIFSMFVVYDTNVILKNKMKQDILDATINFYLSFVNIFNHLM